MSKVKLFDAFKGKDIELNQRDAKILRAIKPQRYRTRDMIMERAAAREELPILTDEVDTEEDHKEDGKTEPARRKRSPSKAAPE